jgi:hypothetical protein
VKKAIIFQRLAAAAASAPVALLIIAWKELMQLTNVLLLSFFPLPTFMLYPDGDSHSKRKMLPAANWEEVDGIYQI